MKKIVIDIGHGYSDSGALGKYGTKESDVVLEIGKEIEKNLKGSNIDVKFTRLDNTYIPLNKRVKIANDFDADYFISIHMNSSNDESVRGVEIWQYNDKNESMNRFSKSVCKEVSNILNIKNRGIKISKEIYVLKNTRMPACLIEIDFISNRQAEKYVNNFDNIQLIAEIIVVNIKNLLG